MNLSFEISCGKCDRRFDSIQILRIRRAGYDLVRCRECLAFTPFPSANFSPLLPWMVRGAIELILAYLVKKYGSENCGRRLTPSFIDEAKRAIFYPDPPAGMRITRFMVSVVLRQTSFSEEDVREILNGIFPWSVPLP